MEQPNTQLVICDYYQLVKQAGQKVNEDFKTLLSSKHLIERKYVNSVNANKEKGLKLYIIDEIATAEYYANLAEAQSIKAEAIKLVEADKRAIDNAIADVKTTRAYNKVNR